VIFSGKAYHNVLLHYYVRMANLEIVENSLRNKNYKNTKKTLTVASAALLAIVIIAAIPSTVLAASPHFVGIPTCTTSGSGTTTKTLTCSGKIAGLGSVSAVTAQIIAIANTQCTNPGGNLPPGHQQAAGAPTTLPVQNGQTVFTLSVSASAGCPPPQVGSVTFTNVGVFVGSTIIPIPGTFDP
jgi:hypothetical protein